MQVSGEVQAQAALPPRKKRDDTYWIGVWVGLRADMIVLRKRKVYCSCRVSTPRNAARIPVAVSVQECGRIVWGENRSVLKHSCPRGILSTAYSTWTVLKSNPSPKAYMSATNRLSRATRPSWPRCSEWFLYLIHLFNYTVALSTHWRQQYCSTPGILASCREKCTRKQPSVRC